MKSGSTTAQILKLTLIVGAAAMTFAFKAKEPKTKDAETGQVIEQSEVEGACSEEATDQSETTKARGMRTKRRTVIRGMI